MIGLLLFVELAAMVLPLVVSLVEGDGMVSAYAMSMAVMFAAGLLCFGLRGRGKVSVIHERESFFITSLLWIVLPLAGALPYLFGGMELSPLDAIFESFSGFTTTGSTIFSHPESLPPSLLVWRAATQWIGGMGLVLFVVAVYGGLRMGGATLYDAEFSGTAQRRLHPHIAQSVRRMLSVYLCATLLLMALLLLLGNRYIDAVCYAFSTVSTGGFMTSSAGLTPLSSSSLAVVTVFMFTSGINLALLYNLFTLRWRLLRDSSEFRTYALIFLVAALLTTTVFVAIGNGFVASVSYSFFHVASAISTCGYYIAPLPYWTFAVAVIVFPLLFVGAMSGSTGGGIKVKRVMIVMRYIRNYFTRMVHPHAVFGVKVDGMVISDDYNNKVFAFVFLYLAFVLGGAFMLTVAGVDLSAALAMAAANMANLGPAAFSGALGVSLSYEVMPVLAKITLMVLMVAGRIEIFALVALFSPSYWRRGK